MTSLHTPGPWTAEPPDHVDIYGNPVPVDLFTPEYWFISGPGADVHGLMTAADARLIAAAPDLLAVLQDLQESAGYWSEYDVPIGIVERINAAIAQATGGAS